MSVVNIISVSPILLSAEMAPFLQDKRVEEMISNMRLFGMWKSEHDRALLGILEQGDLVARGVRYFDYRNSPDQVVYICTDESEYDGLKDTEQRCQGIPFTICLGKITSQIGVGRSATVDEALVEHYKTSLDSDAVIFGFHKPL